MTMQGTTPAAGGGTSSSTSGDSPEPSPTKHIPRADTTTPPSDRLGPYRLVQVIGEGGMGVVHLGVDDRGRAVAVKVLRDHVAHDADSRARLDREVQTLSRIRHPRVAPVLDADTTGPRPYVVTRYIPGVGLDHVVRDSGPFVGDDLARLGRGLAEALGAIHAAGIVHRDLKPGNVLMVDGDPVVIDFGIAHIADDTRLTMTGLVMGTPGYLSPEVVRGGAVSTATDWWGWAATVLFAATGRPPFGRGPLPVVLDRVRDGEPDVEGLSPALRDLFTRALAPDAAQRPSSGELVAGLSATVAAPTVAVAGPTQALRTDDTRPQPIVRPTVAEPVQRVLTQEENRSAVPVPPAGNSFRPGQQSALRPLPPIESLGAGVGTTARANGSQPPAWGEPVGAPSRPGEDPARRPADDGSDRSDPLGSARRAFGRLTARDGTPGEPAHGATAHDAAPRVPYHERPIGDPRLGRPGRSLALTLLAVLVAALAATWPLAALVIALTWSIVARTSERVVSATVQRRHSYGAARPTDTAMAAASSPLHLLAGVLATALALLPATLVGVSGAFLTSVVAAVPLGHTWSIWAGPCLFVGALLAQWTVWWGPGGLSLQRGSRSMMRALTPEGPATRVVMIGMAVIVVALGMWSVMSHGVPSFAPYDGPPFGSVSWQW